MYVVPHKDLMLEEKHTKNTVKTFILQPLQSVSQTFIHSHDKNELLPLTGFQSA